jgi:hypothetical protein
MEVALGDLRGTAKFKATPEVRITCGERLQNGAITDLVSSPDRDGLSLLSWDGKKKPVIAPAMDCGGIFYRPPDLHPSVREAITFPSGAVEYGTTTKLFTRISCLYREYVGLPEDLAAYVTCWTLCSWVPEFLLIVLTLCVSGGCMHQIHNLLKLFGSLCRRALLVAELSRRLPHFLHPTLIVSDPNLSAKAVAFWRAASCSGTFVAGAGSTLCELSCPKAVVLQPGDSPQAWGEEAMFLTLPHFESARLSNQVLANIAAEFQPQLEMFRLRVMTEIEPFASPSHPLSKFELARDLGACIPEDPGIIQILTPLLESHEQDILALRSRDPRVAILEAVWAPSHEQNEMSVAEITKRVNAILHSRGENLEYSAREIGWKLRNLHLCTTSNGKCKVLRFSAETRYQIHRCVREYGLQLPFRKDCDDCQGLQAPDKKAVE